MFAKPNFKTAVYLSSLIIEVFAVESFYNRSLLLEGMNQLFCVLRWFVNCLLYVVLHKQLLLLSHEYQILIAVLHFIILRSNLSIVTRILCTAPATS